MYFGSNQYLYASRMLISLRTAFMGAGVALAFVQSTGSAAASFPPAFPLLPSFACTTISQITTGYAICSGANSTSHSVGTDNDSLDVEFVYFSDPQSGNAVYDGVVLLSGN